LTNLYHPAVARLRATMLLASDVEGLRRTLTSDLGHEYRVTVADDGSQVGLWRLGRGV
jgi:hypothetical protein